MIKSMTGFGKGSCAGRSGSITAEIRTLNHKYFDVVSRLPNHLAALEDKVRECVKRKIKRGRINVSIGWEGKEKSPAAFSLNFTAAKKYYRELLKLQKSLHLENDLGLSQIISLPEVIIYDQKKESADYIWPLVYKALEQALDNLEQMREAEGKRLCRDLSKRAGSIRRCLASIEAQLPQVIARYRRNLFKKVKAFSGIKAPNDERIAEEVALFVRNSDVSEELTRVKSHLKAFKHALHSQREVGKELDFIAQELFREANTIGAKASSFKISRWVIKIKSQIEKMREQLQNVE